MTVPRPEQRCGDCGGEATPRGRSNVWIEKAGNGWTHGNGIQPVACENPCHDTPSTEERCAGRGENGHPGPCRRIPRPEPVERGDGDCGVCGIPADTMRRVTPTPESPDDHFYGVPRCLAHIDSPAYQAESRLAEAQDRARRAEENARDWLETARAESDMVEQQRTRARTAETALHEAREALKRIKDRTLVGDYAGTMRAIDSALSPSTDTEGRDGSA